MYDELVLSFRSPPRLIVSLGLGFFLFAGCRDEGLVGTVHPCVAVPEVCDDGVDNDCDGVVDESECAAGCDGECACDFLSTGRAELLPPEYRIRRPEGFSATLRPEFNLKAMRYEAAFDGSNQVAVARHFEVLATGEVELVLDLKGLNGSQIAPRVTLETGELLMGPEGVSFGGEAYGVVWRRLADPAGTGMEVRAAWVSRSGTVTAGPQTLASGAPMGATIAEGVLYAAYLEGGKAWIRGYDENLDPAGAAIDLGEAQFVPLVERMGDAVAVLLRGPESSMEIAVVRRGAVVGRHVLGPAPSPDQILVRFASNGTEYLACWREGPVDCRFGSAVDGGPTSPVFRPVANALVRYGLAHTGCGFTLHSGIQVRSGEGTVYEVRRLAQPTLDNPSGVVGRSSSDRQWDQPGREFRAFSLPDGRLLRVNGSTVTTLTCGSCDRGPAPDCAVLVAPLCQYACDCSLPNTGDSCVLRHTTLTAGGGMDGCTTVLAPEMCEALVVDTRDCAAALEETLDCTDREMASSVLETPPDCLLPAVP